MWICSDKVPEYVDRRIIGAMDEGLASRLMNFQDLLCQFFAMHAREAAEGTVASERRVD